MIQKTICFFNSARTWGGGEKWHYEMALFMQQSGCKVLFITSPGSILQHKLPDTITCIPFKVGNLSFINPFKVIRLKKTLKKYQVRSIIINLSSDLKLAGLAARSAKVNRIIYRRGSAIPVKNSILNRFYFGKILTDILANSEATKKTILQNNPDLFPKNKIKVIYNPVHTEEFIKRKYKPVYTRRDGELILGNIGRLVHQKNQQFLIDLAVRLKSMAVPFKILIAGSGPLEEKLKKEAKEKGVSKEVFFCGFLENVKDVLMSCDIFILSSLWEGFGYVLAEASLCSKPIIAFDISSNPELVINNKTGFLCPVNEIKPVLDKIQLFREQPQTQDQFGKDGQTYIKENFSDEKIKSALSDYLSL